MIWGIDPFAKPHAPGGSPDAYYSSLLDEYERLKSIDVIQNSILKFAWIHFLSFYFLDFWYGGYLPEELGFLTSWPPELQLVILASFFFFVGALFAAKSTLFWSSARPGTTGPSVK